MQKWRTSAGVTLRCPPAKPVKGLDLSNVIALAFNIKVVAGRNLSAKDGGGLLGGERTSDPYCVVFFQNLREKSPAVAKSLNPTWDWSCSLQTQGRKFQAAKMQDQSIRVKLFDYDSGMFDSDDPMGEVVLPVSALLHAPVDRWLPVQGGSGEVHIVASGVVRKVLSMKQHESLAITDNLVAIALGWDMLKAGREAIDLDTVRRLGSNSWPQGEGSSSKHARLSPEVASSILTLGSRASRSRTAGR